ncbi:MAG: hypothetical protein ACJ78Q_10750 [Chloroflexia bacterium]
MRPGLMLVAAMVLAIGAPGVAQACEPRDHGAEFNLELSDVAFVGRVLSRTQDQRALNADYECTVAHYRFRVKTAWKGVSSQEISLSATSDCKVREPQPWLNCEVNDWGDFEVGQAYLVYANYNVYENDSSLYAWVGAAGASKPVSEAGEEMRELSALVPPIIPAGMPIAGVSDMGWLCVGLLGCALSAIGLWVRGFSRRVG